MWKRYGETAMRGHAQGRTIRRRREGAQPVLRPPVASREFLVAIQLQAGPPQVLFAEAGSLAPILIRQDKIQVFNLTHQEMGMFGTWSGSKPAAEQTTSVTPPGGSGEQEESVKSPFLMARNWSKDLGRSDPNVEEVNATLLKAPRRAARSRHRAAGRLRMHTCKRARASVCWLAPDARLCKPSCSQALVEGADLRRSTPRQFKLGGTNPQGTAKPLQEGDDPVLRSVRHPPIFRLDPPCRAY
jgi:hypothetical protein